MTSHSSSIPRAVDHPVVVTEILPRFRVAPGEQEIAILAGQMRSGELMVGSCLELFEEALKQALGRKHCAAVANGFAAIHLALEATGIRGRNVLLPAVSTCFAPLQAVAASGNRAIFADVDPSTAGLSVESCRESLRDEPAAIIVTPNHFGIASDVAGLAALGLPVIEDSAQSFLTNTLVPSTADLTVCSFYPSKWINAIDGGAVLTDHLPYDERIRDRRYYDHQTGDDGIRRYNYRLADIHAALGLFWVQRTRALIRRSEEISGRYREVVSEFEGVGILGGGRSDRAVYQKFVLRFPSGPRRDRFVDRMSRRGIPCGAELLGLTTPGVVSRRYPHAARLIETTASIPLYPALTDPEVERVGRELRAALEACLGGAERG